jgi:hypothetical protein
MRKRNSKAQVPVKGRESILGDEKAINAQEKASVLVKLFHHYHQIPDRDNLREERFILGHSFGHFHPQSLAA